MILEHHHVLDIWRIEGEYHVRHTLKSFLLWSNETLPHGASLSRTSHTLTLGAPSPSFSSCTTPDHLTLTFPFLSPESPSLLIPQNPILFTHTDTAALEEKKIGAFAPSSISPPSPPLHHLLPTKLKEDYYWALSLHHQEFTTSRRL